MSNNPKKGKRVTDIGDSKGNRLELTIRDLIVGILVLALIGSGIWWLMSGTGQSEDDPKPTKRTFEIACKTGALPPDSQRFDFGGQPDTLRIYSEKGLFGVCPRARKDTSSVVPSKEKIAEAQKLIDDVIRTNAPRAYAARFADDAQICHLNTDGKDNCWPSVPLALAMINSYDDIVPHKYNLEVVDVEPTPNNLIGRLNYKLTKNTPQ
ncbi:MAG: hypothetical protein AAF998_02285 [Bacteroidota bacterium]